MPVPTTLVWIFAVIGYFTTVFGLGLLISWLLVWRRH